MLDILKYTLEAGVIFFLLNSFYSQVYYSIGYNKWNRIYLLVSILASYAAPLLKIKFYDDRISPDKFVIGDIESVDGCDIITVTRDKTWDFCVGEFLSSTFFNLSVKVLFAIYAVGVAVKLFTFVRGLVKTLRLRRCPVVSQENGCKIYLTRLNTAAFSFFGSIFLGDKAKSLSSGDMQVIIRHEMQHIAGRHSIDTLAFGLMSVLQWFNPAVRKAFRYSRLVCENIADSKASGGNVTDYSRLILRLGEKNVVQATSRASQKNGTLTERILQLFSSDSDKARKIWFLSSLPVLMIALAAYLVIPGRIFPERHGFESPIDGDCKISTGFFEDQTFIKSTGDMFKVSHRQIDFVVFSDSDIVATERGELVFADSSLLKMQIGDLLVTIGGIQVCVSGRRELSPGDIVGRAIAGGHPLFIKTEKNGKAINPATVFRF